MSARERATDGGIRRGGDQTRRIGGELRATRVDRGLSLRTVAAAVGISPAELSRIERGLVTNVSVLVLARICAVLGLELSVRAFPVAEPIRDAAQVSLVEDLRRELHPSLIWRVEVALPRPGDLRAWDATIAGADWCYGTEAETAPHDGQALARRLQLKAPDSEVDGVLLVLRDTLQSRRFLAAAGEYLSPMFPVPGRVALKALRAGVSPGGSSIIVLARRRGVG